MVMKYLLASMSDIRSDLVVVVHRLPSIIWIQLIMILRSIGTLYAMLSTDSLFQKLREFGVIRNLHDLVVSPVAEMIAQ